MGLFDKLKKKVLKVDANSKRAKQILMSAREVSCDEAMARSLTVRLLSQLAGLPEPLQHPRAP